MLGLADVVVLNDPITGQGSNNASKCAASYLATILHLFGLDHLKLTYKFQGRYFRLTDVHGNLVKKMLA